MRIGDIMTALMMPFLIAGCNQESERGAEPFTLYRNSPLDLSRREHFASFDTANHNDYNRGNCGMTARLLNANVAASAKKEGKEPYSGIGFWCEPGAYNEIGTVPAQFDAGFPSDSDSPFHW